MRKQILKRISAFLLAVFFSVSSLVSLSSVASAAVLETVALATTVYDVVKDVGEIADNVSQAIANAVDFRFPVWNDLTSNPRAMDNAITNYNTNGWLKRAFASYPDAWETFKLFYHMTMDNAPPPRYVCRVLLDNETNCYRPAIYNPRNMTSIWLVDVDGHYPYCAKDEWEKFKNIGAYDPSIIVFDGRWLATNSVRDSKKMVQKSYADLDTTKADLANKYPNSSVTISTLKVGGLECKVIRRLEEGPGNRDWVWCDPNGLPYVYIDPDTQGAAQDWNYDKIQEITDNQTQDIKDIVVEQGDKIDKLIDLDSNVTVAPNVSLDPSLDIFLDSFLKLNIDQIIIDRSDDRTIYTVDSHDVTYNVENNFYEYNYYTYNYEFTYNNTYVTYVGSTAEYQPKEWSMYYQLPDGRSSADLTEEDVAGLSFQFQDVVNYKRASTSADLWALYHFDGNTNDDSYYAAENSFHWDRGSSINYMESNAFNGALYLDEQPHQFKLTLPNNLGTRDFTLQWRYYQNSAITSENADNYISMGGKELLRWSEKNLYLSGSSTPCTDRLSIGSWQELALVRSGGTLFLYHNGVPISSTAISGTLGKELTFCFGGASRAYSMMDELRLITRPIAAGDNYTPTAVPYDSNSVLVLPGESTVTDSYYKWDTTITPVLTFDVEKDLSDFRAVTYDSWAHLERNKIYTANSPNVTSDGSLLTLTSDSRPWDNSPYIDGYRDVIISSSSSNPGLTMILTDKMSNRPAWQWDTLALTFVGANLERYTVVLDGVPNTTNQYYKSWTGNFSWGSIVANYVIRYDDSDSYDYAAFVVYLRLAANSTMSFRYMELVPGSQPNTGHQLVTDTYSAADLQPNTAAVQTDIPIKGYTVGGVRPTFPSRGDVWFPAEGNRISGVQIYNGQAWEETNARWWTGKRWIPIYAFDLVTLADMWDVGSSTGQDVTPTITTEIGFWNWWKNQWLEFKQWMIDTFGKCDHDYVEEVLKEPTCTRQGAVMYTCSKCRDSYIDTLDPLGHDWQLVESVPDTVVPGYVSAGKPARPASGYGQWTYAFDGDTSTCCPVGAPGLDGMYHASWDFIKSPYGGKIEIDFSRAGAVDTAVIYVPDGTNGVPKQEVSYFNDYIGSLACFGNYYPYRLFLGFSCTTTDGSSDIPLVAEVRFFVRGEDEVVPGTGYDKYVCARCGKEYIDHERVGPPEDVGGSGDDPSGSGDEDDTTSLTKLIQDLFDSLGDVVGSLIGWVFDLAAEAMEGFGKLGDYFSEKVKDLQGVGGEYPDFLGAIFEVIPPEIKTCISVALVLFGLRLFIRKVIL